MREKKGKVCLLGSGGGVRWLVSAHPPTKESDRMNVLLSLSEYHVKKTAECGKGLILDGSEWVSFTDFGIGNVDSLGWFWMDQNRFFLIIYMYLYRGWDTKKCYNLQLQLREKKNEFESLRSDHSQEYGNHYNRAVRS
ncbi:hypothetical protein RJT34_09558 [Clitoria ternatea]|uniref:Uncharacterized protein n=1 Tax=Clitoria ternatea TaxID=43366 RepID=A0AAN9K706_CLITE